MLGSQPSAVCCLQMSAQFSVKSAQEAVLSPSKLIPTSSACGGVHNTSPHRLQTYCPKYYGFITGRRQNDVMTSRMSWLVAHKGSAPLFEGHFAASFNQCSKGHVDSTFQNSDYHTCCALHSESGASRSTVESSMWNQNAGARLTCCPVAVVRLPGEWDRHTS